MPPAEKNMGFLEFLATIVVAFSWIVTALVSCFAAAFMFVALQEAIGAPQQAAIAACAAAAVVIPYVFSRAIETVFIRMRL